MPRAVSLLGSVRVGIYARAARCETETAVGQNSGMTPVAYTERGGGGGVQAWGCGGGGGGAISVFPPQP